jgi:hypothetical protein
MLIYTLFMPFLYSAFLVDSTLYSLDIEHETVDAINFPRPIIDYVAADFTYIVTDDCLYKIDPTSARIIDRTPLPLRFNYVLLRNTEIILISTDEIIALDRTNLAFKSGIGIERGDHRPIIKDQTFISIRGQPSIFLLSDAGARSTVRAINIESGKTIARTMVKRMKDIIYDPRGMIFIGLEVEQDLAILDLSMKMQKRIHLNFEAKALASWNEDLCIVSDQGIFLMTREGELIDCQPLPRVRNVCGSTLLTDDAIFWLDSLTFRVGGWLQNQNNIAQLLQDASSGYLIGINIHGEMYLIENSPGRVSKLRYHRRELAQILPSSPRADSLWYLQLGAFSNPTYAMQMHEEFRDKRIPVFVDTADLYRIKFGGFTDKPAALDILEAMKLDGWLVFEPRKYSHISEIFYVGVEKFVINEGVVGKE